MSLKSLGLVTEAIKSESSASFRRGPWVVKFELLPEAVAGRADWTFGVMRHLPWLPYKTRWLCIADNKPHPIRVTNNPHKTLIAFEKGLIPEPTKNVPEKSPCNLFPFPNYDGKELELPWVLNRIMELAKVDAEKIRCPAKSETLHVEIPPRLDLWWVQTGVLHFQDKKKTLSFEDLLNPTTPRPDMFIYHQQFGGVTQGKKQNEYTEKKAKLVCHLNRENWCCPPLPNIFTGGDGGTLCAEWCRIPDKHASFMEMIETWAMEWAYSEWRSHLTKGAFDWRWQWEPRTENRKIRFADVPYSIKKTQEWGQKNGSACLPIFLRDTQHLINETYGHPNPKN